jgi:glutathione S-transferase
VTVTLYSLSLSHPSQAARLMLELKGIDHEVNDLLPGFHPPLLRLAGFRGDTVPALRVDGRRVQGSLAISRELDRLRPEPPLFPSDPERRQAVEEAEAWGERYLQPVPRRIFRWAVSRNKHLRVWMARDVVGMPAPGVMAALNAPIARHFARKAHASDEQVCADIAHLPVMLDHVDELISDGTVGDEQPNAADFQIGTAVRVLLAFDDLAPLFDGRPAAELAGRILPAYPGPIPRVLPPEWLATAGISGAVKV